MTTLDMKGGPFDGYNRPLELCPPDKTLTLIPNGSNVAVYLRQGMELTFIKEMSAEEYERSMKGAVT
jgi:hypothetical protein